MGHDESPVNKFNANNIVLTDQAGQVWGTTGTIILSGAKLLLDTGSAWEVVTSAQLSLNNSNIYNIMVVTNKGNGTVSEGTGTIGTRVLRKDYPIEEGLTAGTTKQTGNPNLVEQGF